MIMSFLFILFINFYMRFDNNEIRNYADFLYSLTPNELGIIASLAGLYLSQGLTSNQQNTIGNFLESIGQLIQLKLLKEQL